MNADLKRACLAALRPVHDRRDLVSVAEVMTTVDAALGVRLHAYIIDGVLEPHGYRIGDGEEKRRRESQYVVMRAVSVPVAVRFACDCARHTLSLFEHARPTRSAPPDLEELIELVERWTRSQATAKSVRAKLAEAREVGVQIADDWHRRYGAGEFDLLSKEELDRSNGPLFVVSAVLALGGAVIVRPARRLSCLDQVVENCLEAAMCGDAPGESDKIVNWMKRRLAELVNAEPLTG